MRWTYTPLPADEVEALSRRAGVSPVLAELLLRAGQTDPEAAQRFLRPALAELNDPFLLVNLERAVIRLREAINGRQDIVVLGDYDVDGVSSTALLVSILRRFGLNPRFIVPRRMEDGYGLSRSAIDRAIPMRWRCPPENSKGNRTATPGLRPTFPSNSSTRSRRCARSPIPWIAKGSSRISRTV